MDVTQLSVLAAAACAAALVMSVSGFGFGLVSMGFYPLFMPLQHANVIVSALGIPMVVVNLVSIRHRVNFKVLWPILIGAAVGVPAGIWGLVRIPENVLLIGLGALILVTLLTLELAAKGRSWKPSLPGAGAAGLVGGAFGGAYSISGPPVILYLTTIFEDKNELKANLLAYFLIQIGFRFILLAAGGIVTLELLKMALFLLLPTAVGMVIGTIIFKRISSPTMRRIAQVLLAVSSIVLIVRAV
jgi:uncharacterized membrane protein YfcA